VVGLSASAARRAGRVLACAAAVALVCFLLRRMPAADIAAALRGADPLLFALAVAVYLTSNTVAKVCRWAALLRAVPRSGPEVGGVALAQILFASQATSNLLPARAGEALRVVELRRRGYGVPGLLAAQGMEKIVEAGTLCLSAGCAAALAGMPPMLRVPVWTVALLGVALLALVAVVRLLPPRPREPGGKVSAFLARLADGMDGVASLGVWPRSVGWSCAADFSDAAVLGLCLYSAGLHVVPASWLVVLLAINLAILVPSTPAYLGVVEAAACAALVALGVPAERALAGAVLYHAVQIVPSTALGLWFLRKQWAHDRSAA